MLHLVEFSDDAEPRNVAAVDDALAAALERALLAVDASSCTEVLAAAMERDAVFGRWASHEAGLALHDLTVDAKFAAQWWSDRLATKLASRIATVESPNAVPAFERRLTAIVAKLADYEARLADFDRRLEHEKLESLKELAYGAGHEVNNPLANIAARAQTLLEEEPHPERQRKLAAIHRQAMRAHEMIADLMLFARPPKLNLAECDLRFIVRQVVDELGELASERTIQIACETGDTPSLLRCDETQLAVAIGAVVRNAVEAVGTNGHVTVLCGLSDRDNARWAEVVVRDDGPGISAEVRRHLFDPFFSGREAGRGLGFGLSKCWRIVTEHGGQVVVSSGRGRGAEFTIVLPAI
jgi:signal transduction histidine kinase